MKKDSNYHHGNLRAALLRAASQELERSGYEALSLRELAASLDVSRSAPYRHFEDKDALLQAVSELAFLGLDEVARRASTLAPYGSSACLIAQGKAYIGFVADHPAFYDLMWGDLGLRKRNIQDMELQTSGFYMLVDCVRAWCTEAGLTSYDPLELAVKFWAMAHGLACLTMNGNIEQIMPSADVFGLFESSAMTFLDGLRPSKQALN